MDADDFEQLAYCAACGGAKALTGSRIKRWSTGELSVVDRPCLPSATFVLRGG